MILESLELEQQFLFLCFKHQEQFNKLAVDINEKSFANNAHRKIFKFLKENVTHGQTSSIQTSLNILQNSTEDEIERLAFKSAMEKVCKSVAKFEDHMLIVDQLKRYETTRKFLKSIRQTTDDITQNTTLEAGITKLEKDLQSCRQRLLKISDLAHMKLKEDIDKRIEHVKQVKTNPGMMGLVQTGFKNFDKFLPAIPQGCLYLYMARPSVGKSMFLMGTALHNFKTLGNKVVYITIEMSAREVLFRMDSHISTFVHKDIVMGNVADNSESIQIWKEKVTKFGKDGNDIDVFWIPENCSPKKIEALLLSLNYKPDLIVVDYAGDMDCDDNRLSKYDPKAQALVYDGLKNIAQKFECVLFSAQQIKRGTGKKQKTTEDGYGSDKGAQRADGLISLEITEEDSLYEDNEVTDGFRIRGRISIYYTKNRQGELLKTYVKPLFHKMAWWEPPFEEELWARGGKEEVQKKDTNKYKKASEVGNMGDPIPVEDIPIEEEKEATNNILDNLLE